MRFELALRGGGGEPVSFERTIHSHGLVTLPPNRQAANEPTLPRRLNDGSLTLATLRAGRAGFADVEVTDRRRSGTFAEAVQGKLRAVPRGDLRAFPTPQAMADAPESFYCERMKAGYRGAYLGTIAADVAAGRLDLEAFPGLLRGRSVCGRPHAAPARPHTPPTIRFVDAAKILSRHFRPYGRFAGLAFWLFITRDSIDETLT